MSSCGATVRRGLGPLEHHAVDAYRNWFVDVDELTADIAALGPFTRVLEIGAGDGMVSAGLADRLPGATVLGIDIAAAPGRMVDDPRLSFRQVGTAELRAEGDGGYDLVVVSDVLHHVPAADRGALVRDAGALAAPGGTIVVKEWERQSNLAHRAADFADRYISGDRGVSFLSRPELVALLAEHLPDHVIRAEFRVPPRRNNLLLALRATAAG